MRAGELIQKGTILLMFYLINEVKYERKLICKGQIGYALVPMIARGVMLGSSQLSVIMLHMLDIPLASEALNDVKLMELIDASFPLLKGVVATTDVVEACNVVNIAVMVGGYVP